MENLTEVATEQNNQFRPVQNKSQLVSKIIQIALVVVILAIGITTGLIMSSRAKSKQLAQTLPANNENLTPQQEKNVQTVTRDSAEGVLEKNDKFEETSQGQWKLIRPGGDSQTAYLTSSYMDLDEYVGKKVKVYGETLGSDKVGWLMDVAKVEVEN